MRESQLHEIKTAITRFVLLYAHFSIQSILMVGIL